MGEKKSKIKGIFTIDAYDRKYYLLKNQKLIQQKKLTYNSANFVSTYINNKEIISSSVEISRSIPIEDTEDILEIKAYEELGLDQAVEYSIKYIERETTGDSRIFDLFVVDLDVLGESFVDITYETKYIDLIVPAPLLYKAVYDREILADDGVHCFIYITQSDAFITFYQDGQYLYSKSIEYSLERIYDKYCELSGDRVDEADFFKILESEGLKTVHADYQQNLMKLFGDIFITINDIVIYAKRAFDLDTIDQMFIGSSLGPIIGLDEYSENYLGLQSSELNFNFNLENDDWYIDQLQLMLTVTSMEYLEDIDSTINFTIFERAPVFYKRTSGQFIIATGVSIMLGISYPLVYLVGSYMNDATNMVLSAQEKQLSAEDSKYKKILGEKKKELKALDAKISDKAYTYHGKEKTLTSIYDKKVNYRLKSELLYIFAKDIRRFKVNTDYIASIGDTFIFSLLSKDNKEITRLIKYISETHFDEINSINIDEIYKIANNGFYYGTLRVELKSNTYDQMELIYSSHNQNKNQNWKKLWEQSVAKSEAVYKKILAKQKKMDDDFKAGLR
ncbi:FIG00470756: hypothetical protein [hydrothermal vent metagenome]|uniref:Uncharacterized protein n=1 Tax=hydrothermal vent metagenome TaxID=652676 RepID=A0A1W1BI32_9ZZZZ